MSTIHPTAIVSKKAELGKDVIIGPYTIIEDDVVIGDGCELQSSVVIANGARLGMRVKVSHHAVIATQPQDLKFGGEESLAVIGDDTVIREFVTFNRGTIAHGEASIGKKSFVMTYAHVAHDCIIGDNVILANAVQVAGHVEIDDYAILGGVLPIHQFVKIGAHAMIGGGYRVQQDVCPFALVAGYPLKVIGINAVGLRRRGFSRETIQSLQKVFKLLFFSDMNTSQAVARIPDEVEVIPEVQLVLDFIERSNRGLVK